MQGSVALNRCGNKNVRRKRALVRQAWSLPATQSKRPLPMQKLLRGSTACCGFILDLGFGFRENLYSKQRLMQTSFYRYHCRDRGDEQYVLF